MQPQKAIVSDILLLSIPILASVYFFIRYANRFHPSNSATTGDVLVRAFQSEAVRLYFFLILVPYSAIIIYFASRTDYISYHILIALFLYVSLFIYYGRFLITYDSGHTLPLVRHWLIWPVILSIAIGLYYGLSFSDLKGSFFPLVPIGIVIFLYISSQILNLSRRLFLWLTLLVVSVVTTLSVLNQIGYLLLLDSFNLPTMLFCLAASAYLAVFEAWRITSDIAKAEQAINLSSATETSAISADSYAFRYAQATLVALTISVWVLPFYYIFSNYGSPFLLGFAVHAFAAFVFWFYFGKSPYLGRWPWSSIKVVAGVLFLLLLVLSPTYLFKEQFTFRFMKGFAGWVGFSILLVFVFILVGRLLKDYDSLRDEGAVAPIYVLFGDRINFIRVLSLLCLFFCLIITGLLQTNDETSLQYSRAELAFQVYAICIALCFILEGVEHFRQKPKMPHLLRTLIGLLLVIRVFTSLMIALVVVLPLMHAGAGVTHSLLSALPFFCAGAGGFALNDYYDVSKDMINKPYRAIPSGKMRPKVALWIGVSLLGTAFILSLVSFKNSFELFLYIASIIAVATYNFFVKHLALSKTFLTAAVSSLPLLYVVVTLSYPSIYLLLPASSLVFLLGRELLMDIRDVKGDGVSGITTLPMVIGTQRTAKLGFLLLLICSGILFVFTVNVWSAQNLVLSCLTFATSMFITLFWSLGSGRHQRLMIISLYIPMLCGILMLLH